MASDVDIANLALGYIGVGKLIQSVTNDQSNEAKHLRARWDMALQSVLQAAHWNFARAQRALTLLKDATNGDTLPRPWTYEYEYPPDCAQVRYILPQTYASPGASGSGYPVVVGSAPPVRFLVGVDLDANGNDRKVILTNEPQAEAVFTKTISNVGLYDSQFVIAFASYLGHLVAGPISADRARAKEAYDLSARMCMEAEASNGNEGLTIDDHTPDWLAVRGFAADWAYPPNSMFVNGPAALTLVA